MVNNAAIVSGRQQRDSAIHTHVSILPQTPLPSRLPHNIEQTSLCHVLVGYPFYYFLKIYLSILGVLGLCCCMWAFSSCGEWRVHSTVHSSAGFSVRWLLLWSTGSRARRFSCLAVGGIFQDQGSNLCPLHQQVDS